MVLVCSSMGSLDALEPGFQMRSFDGVRAQVERVAVGDPGEFDVAGPYLAAVPHRTVLLGKGHQVAVAFPSVAARMLILDRSEKLLVG